MKKNILLTAAALVTTLAGVAQWQPAGDRIRTQWGEKLDPQNVLPGIPASSDGTRRLAKTSTACGTMRSCP